MKSALPASFPRLVGNRTQERVNGFQVAVGWQSVNGPRRAVAQGAAVVLNCLERFCGFVVNDQILAHEIQSGGQFPAEPQLVDKQGGGFDRRHQFVIFLVPCGGQRESASFGCFVSGDIHWLGIECRRREFCRKIRRPRRPHADCIRARLLFDRPKLLVNSNRQSKFHHSTCDIDAARGANVACVEFRIILFANHLRVFGQLNKRRFSCFPACRFARTHRALQAGSRQVQSGNGKNRAVGNADKSHAVGDSDIAYPAGCRFGSSFESRCRRSVGDADAIL